MANRPNTTTVAQAYLLLARNGHRPAAPNNGLGDITTHPDDLDITAEAIDYATRFLAEEDTNRFWVGCSDYRNYKTMVMAIEVARLCCGGIGNEDLIRRLLHEAERQLPVIQGGNAA